MKHFLTVFLTVLSLLLAIPCVNAHAAEGFLKDEGGRLDEEEFAACDAALQEVAEKTGMNVAVILGVQDLSNGTIESTAKSSYEYLFGEKTDGIIYYMDLAGSTHYDYIATFGMGQFYYTNARSNDRIKEMFKRLNAYMLPAGSEDLPGAIECYADLVAEYYELGIPENYYYYDKEEGLYYSLGEDGRPTASKFKPYLNWTLILLGAGVGLICGLIAAGSVAAGVRSRYKFKYSLSPTTYISRKDLQMNEQRDQFIRSYTSKVPVNAGNLAAAPNNESGDSGGGESSGGAGGEGNVR